VSIDLHTHTLASDGTTTPAQNAALAAEAGLVGFALTDHDTLAGWDEAAHHCARLGLAFVPGVELSTEDAGESVHVLGYWVHRDDTALQAECDRLYAERFRRGGVIIGLLAGLGVGVEPARVAAIAGTAPVGRPHIAQALVEAGHVKTIDEAFVRYLADGGPAHVAKRAVSPEDGVRLIRGAGGVAVLAHPGLCHLDRPQTPSLVERLCAVGLAGVEAEHAGHGPEAVSYWRQVAVERDLLVTGSSDFHGTRKETKMGASTTPVVVVEALRERADAAVAAGGRQPW